MKTILVIDDISEHPFTKADFDKIMSLRRPDQTERQRRYDRKPLPMTVSIVCDATVGVHKEFRVDYHTDRGGIMRRNQDKPYANKAERRALKRERVAELKARP